MKTRIGTRKSPLALAQARMVADALQAVWPDVKPELVPMTTSGDRFAGSLTEVGGKGLFTKELEEALLEGRIDIAVHSMKDMPVFLPSGLTIAAMLAREDARDMLVGQGIASPGDISKGASLGTSSPRRAAQMLILRPDLNIVPLRGNVQTRLDKIARGEASATLLAVAGLKRLGLQHIPGCILSIDECLPAVAQGAIGIECREDDAAIRERLGPLSHAPTETAVTAERAFLRVLDGSCRTPIAGYAEIHGEQLTLRGLVAKPDGSNCQTITLGGPAKEAQKLGEEAGDKLAGFL